jgi:methionyl-tRNA formyltransferase
MRIVYFGSGDFGLDCLNALRDSKHVLEFILTQPARAAGRGRRTTPTAVACWAQQYGISCVETADASDPAIIERVRSANPDLILVIAFGQKICDELLELAPKGMINVHSSLLPKYRGAAPINWAVINGDEETGVTIATVTKQWDAGAVLAQTKTKIEPDETADVLGSRLAALAAPVLIETLYKIENGSAAYCEQDHSKATLAPKLKKSDGYIDFDAPAESIRNAIRGLWPWPGASANFVSQATGKMCRVTFEMAVAADSTVSKGGAPGSLDDNLNVVCADGLLKVTRIKPAGKKSMTFKAFVNGHRVAANDRFVKIEE